MPRYFFDLNDGRDFHQDDEGSDLQGIEQARFEAKALMSQIVRERLPLGERHAFEVMVRGEDGAVLYHATLTFEGRRLESGLPVTAD